MNLQEKIHRYPIDIFEISKNLGFKIDKPKRLRFKHPVLLDDGSLIFNSLDRIIKIDKCGNLLAASEDINAHHSVEIDNKGNIYTPVLLDKENIKNYSEYHSDGFINDGFAILDKNLKLKKLFLIRNLKKIIYCRIFMVIKR